jgi:hypothetical protein
VWWVVVVHQDTHENLEHAWVMGDINLQYHIYYDAHDNTDMLSYRHYSNKLTDREREREREKECDKIKNKIERERERERDSGRELYSNKTNCGR